MSEQIIIKSKLKNYTVEFVDDIFERLHVQAASNSFLIIDSILYDLFKNRFNTILSDNNYLVVKAMEEHKTYNYCGKIIEELISKKIRKNNKIIAIGGGIIQDISAFISSILFRGLDWSFIPTTLLAQADSCIGGKTSINFGEVKNTIGNFNPPTKIFIDTMFLNTLSLEDIKSGIGEMAHFYFYDNSVLIDKLFNEYQNILIDRKLLKEYIIESLRIKKTVIEVDEFDKGERNKFNYGHTFGHALESVTHYSIKHGQAVTLGMDIANQLSMNLGLMDPNTFYFIHSKLKMNFPEYDLTKINIHEYIELLSKDKKNVDDQLVCILSEGPGKLIKMKTPMDAIFNEFLLNYFSNWD